MSILGILGWISNIFFIYGVWAVGKKNVHGFYANSIANLLYAWQSILMDNHPLFWLSILLILLNLKGIYEWQFKNNKRFSISNQQKHAEKVYNSTLIDFFTK